MAKKKQATKQLALELDKTLVVNDTIYNVNAVHSDSADFATNAAEAEHANAAGCVDNPLAIHKYSSYNNPGGYENVEYTGTRKVTIDIVPASGGAYKGDISVPDPINTPLEDSAVINYKQIKAKIEQLTGSSIYSWNGNTLEEFTLPNSETLEKVSLITGAYNNLNSLISSDNSPKAFLYLCTDHYGEIYLKLPDEDPVPLAAGTTYIVGSTDDSTFTGDSIAEKFTKFATDIATNTKNIETNTKNITKNSADITTITNTIADFKDGDVVVKNSTNADKLKVGTTYQPGDYFQKKITISDKAPSGGSNGDIWIKY
jgi:hypothetical protein